jgi:hypothetical protein
VSRTTLAPREAHPRGLLDDGVGWLRREAGNPRNRVCTGDVYEYFDVPRAVFRALLAASSKGRFFHAELDGVYRFEQVTRARRRRR